VLTTPPRFRSLASKFFILTGALVFWVVAVILAYDLRQDAFDVRKGVLLFFVVLLVAGATSRMAIRLLGKPLGQLHAGIQSVREGRLEPIAVSKTGDEIEFLGDSFNQMIEALSSTQDELVKHRQLLEERIRQRTAELEIAMQEALAASNTKSEFLANISHELRTPMNGVLGMLNMISMSQLDAEQRDNLETAQRCAYSLLAMLNDVLDLSKIEAGRMALEVIPFSFRSVVDDCVETHAALAAAKQVAFKSRIDPDLPELLAGDPLRLRQILTNLLSNAVKFTEQGVVTLQARKLPSPEHERVLVELTVIDTGIGIPVDKMDAIFEKFTQADTSISRRFGGTGLGLAITRSLVDMQHGTIHVTSELGKGSTFVVQLPYAFLDESVAHDAAGAGPTTIAPILIVEDNHVNQKLVSALLQKQGYVVTIATNGSEALRAMEQEDFRMVLMDVQMPVMDGLEATRLIRSNPRWQSIPIVAMTARAMEGDQQNCLAAGMNAYISKPIHAAHLLSVVEEFSNPPISPGQKSPASA
jgi:signal transduction histidine kinase/ActR/RegA family two-component response regulator